MGSFNVTPNMQLPNPVPGVDPGPDYAQNLQSSLNIIDQHNHTAGQGVQIQPAGLNINSDLPFNGNNAIALRSVRFLSQSAPIPNTSPDVGCLYVSGNELWFNDYNGGNQVQITTNGQINATSSGISSGTASASFSAGTLVVKSSSTSYANIDVQSVVLANAGNLSNQLTLLSPTLSSSFDLTLPSVPSALSILTVDASGNMGYTMNATSANPVGAAMSSAGADPIGVAMTSVGADAVANTRTRAVGSSVGAGGVAISGSSGTGNTTSGTFAAIPNQSVTLVTTGRPVQIILVSIGTSAGNPGFVGGSNTGSGLFNAEFAILRDATIIAVCGFSGNQGGTTAPGSISFVDVSASAGSHVYSVQYRANTVTPGSSANFGRVATVAYEL